MAETVIDEKQLDLLTCVRIMNLLTLAPGNNFVSFYSVAFVGCFPGDTGSHTMTAQVLTSTEKVIATAREHVFRFGFRVDPYGPGAFSLTTAWRLDVSDIPLGMFLVRVNLDGAPIAQTGLMLRRGKG